MRHCYLGAAGLPGRERLRQTWPASLAPTSARPRPGDGGLRQQPARGASRACLPSHQPATPTARLRSQAQQHAVACGAAGALTAAAALCACRLGKGAGKDARRRHGSSGVSLDGLSPWEVAPLVPPDRPHLKDPGQVWTLRPAHGSSGSSKLPAVAAMTTTRCCLINGGQDRQTG